MEYIAAFLAGLFPGALVAFNYEQIQALPHGAALRVYCAGIWHNAAVCALSVLALFLLPLISYPFYVHGENLMVLDISPVSPLSEYLAPGDVIVSLNGIQMHDLQEWIETITSINEQAIKNVRPHGDIKGIMEVNDKRGYCVPNSLIEESMHIQPKEGMYIQPKEDQITCPNEFTAFKALSCLGSSISNDDNIEDVELNKREDIFCLSAKDIVKQKKCGGGWGRTLSNVSSCSCSEVESCLTPVQMPSLTWLEITYSRPYFIECRQIGRNLLPNNVISDLSEIGCGGTFVFIGDINSMAHSLSLTEYQPRWSYAFGASLPHALEKLLMCTFYVSLGLALVNSLPVYLLDGESILDIVVCCLGFLSKRKRNTILQSCLFGGTVISILVLLRIFLAML